MARKGGSRFPRRPSKSPATAPWAAPAPRNFASSIAVRERSAAVVQLRGLRTPSPRPRRSRLRIRQRAPATGKLRTRIANCSMCTWAQAQIGSQAAHCARSKSGGMLAGLPARSPARKRIAIATSTADPMKAVLPARGAHDRQIEAPRNLAKTSGALATGTSSMRVRQKRWRAGRLHRTWPWRPLPASRFRRAEIPSLRQENHTIGQRHERLVAERDSRKVRIERKRQNPSRRRVSYRPIDSQRCP